MSLDLTALADAQLDGIDGDLLGLLQQATQLRQAINDERSRRTAAAAAQASCSVLADNALDVLGQVQQLTANVITPPPAARRTRKRSSG